MRLVSPYTFCLFVVLWTAFFLFASRRFLFNAHQSWFQGEEERFLGEITFKIDNLDARNLRQLNQLYSEIKKLEGMVSDLKQSHGPATEQHSSEDPPARSEREVESDPATLEPSIPVLVITCNRADYLTKTLDSLLKYRPSAGLFPVVVSQDCTDEATTRAIGKYGQRITHIMHPNHSDVVIPVAERKTIKNVAAIKGYFKVSRHYRWALSQVFDDMGYDFVIIVEDDLEIAPDFYSYFSALRPLLSSDQSLWCVSAWNDNGKGELINMQQNDLLYRTDFFPGLGWMLTKQLWQELKPKWPLSYWDDWMRESTQRRDRACIRPEVSRTKTFGSRGVSGGYYYRQHLQYIVLNSQPVDFSSKDLSYLHQDAYEREFVTRVQHLPVITTGELLSNQRTELHEVQVHYGSKKEFEDVTKKLHIMSDLRSGVPRTAYKGIVSFMNRGRHVHLTPTPPWPGYQPT